MTSIATFAIAATRLDKFFSLGPSHFMILHMHQLLKTMILIGDIKNLYLVETLSVSIYPLDMIFLD